MATEELMQQAEQCFWHGQFPEAIQLLERLETREKATKPERLQSQLLKCRVLTLQDLKKAQELVNQIIEASHTLDHPLIRVDALILLTQISLDLGNIKSMTEYLYQAKAALATLPPPYALERPAREAQLLGYESVGFWMNGLQKRALECAHQSFLLSEQLKTPHLIAQSLFWLGVMHYGYEFQQTLDYLHQSLQLSKLHNYPVLTANTLYQMGWVHLNMARDSDLAIEYIQESLTIFEQLNAPQMIIRGNNGLCKAYLWKGELNRALDYSQISLQLIAQQDIPGTGGERKALLHTGWVYELKGDLETALEYYHQSLTLVEALKITMDIGLTLNRICHTYLMQGNLELAYEYGLKGLKVREEYDSPEWTCGSLPHLIIIAIELGQVELARQYETKLISLKQQLGRMHDHDVLLARALLLKASPRGRDKMQAQALFQQIVDEDMQNFEWTTRASLQLCELLFLEFQISETSEILQEIHTLTDRLQALAHTQHAYGLLAETTILQAKLALVEMDVPQAQHLLTQAQLIADEKGLERLAQHISTEYDALLAQFPQWETLQAQHASFAETRKLARIQEELYRITRQRVPIPPDRYPEDPLLLLILDEGGLSRFSHSFANDSQLDEHLIGGFLTALTAFGQDALATSGAIDRITYHDYTVAVKPLASMLVCYIFQGPSYLALQKLEQFLSRIQETINLYQALTSEIHPNAQAKALSTLDPGIEADLQHLTTEIFTSKHHLHDPEGLP